MDEYTYKGPVYRFNTYVGEWEGSTSASSPGKAKVNLTYQYKKEKGLNPNTNVRLTGNVKLVMEEEE